MCYAKDDLFGPPSGWKWKQSVPSELLVSTSLPDIYMMLMLYVRLIDQSNDRQRQARNATRVRHDIDYIGNQGIIVMDHLEDIGNVSSYVE